MSEGAVTAPTDLKLAYAVTDQVVVFGIGTDFVKSVLDASAGESLADTERFSTALTQAGKEHASLFWLDVAATRDFVEGMVPTRRPVRLRREPQAVPRGIRYRDRHHDPG